MMVSLTWHNFFTAFLVYLVIGGLIWCVLSGVGVIVRSFEERPHAPVVAFVGATVVMIASWPLFMGVFVWRMLRPVVWRWVTGMVRRTAR